MKMITIVIMSTTEISVVISIMLIGRIGRMEKSKRITIKSCFISDISYRINPLTNKISPLWRLNCIIAKLENAHDHKTISEMLSMIELWILAFPWRFIIIYEFSNIIILILGNSQFKYEHAKFPYESHLWCSCLYASSAVQASSRNPWLCLTYHRNHLDHNRVDYTPLGIHNGIYTENPPMNKCYLLKKNGICKAFHFDATYQ